MKFSNETVTVKDIQELFTILGDYSNNYVLHPDFIFRGQALSEWSLEPSFTRLVNKKELNRKKAIQLERESVNKFSTSAKNILPFKNTVTLSGGGWLDFIGWFLVMQHYKAPTRCLDWTNSPWVALYFACCDRINLGGALWVADFKEIDKYRKSKLNDEFSQLDENEKETCKIKDTNTLFTYYLTKDDSPDIIACTRSLTANERIDAQQSRFTVCTNPLTDHREILESINAVKKIEIPANMKLNIMVELKNMNITAQALFPGIDGLGISINDYCRFWDKRSKIE